MISKSQIKLITSLQQKKYRDKEGMFIAEGPKVISELMREGLELHWYFSSQMVDENNPVHHLISAKELQKISALKTANTALAVFKIPGQKKTELKELIVALDAIRDPGNLGAIIRLCDWFGVKQMVCSKDTVDCFNPKVVQASMGSLARVNIEYTSLPEFLEHCELPVYGAVMAGRSIYESSLAPDCILVMGNEANGISSEVIKLLSDKVAIPQFGDIHATESLNVATATAILLSEFRRTTET